MYLLFLLKKGFHGLKGLTIIQTKNKNRVNLVHHIPSVISICSNVTISLMEKEYFFKTHLHGLFEPISLISPISPNFFLILLFAERKKKSNLRKRYCSCLYKKIGTVLEISYHFLLLYYQARKYIFQFSEGTSL